MKAIKVILGSFNLLLALLLFIIVVIDFQFRVDWQLTLAACWLVGIGLFLVVRRNLLMSKNGRILFLLNFVLCTGLLIVIGIPNFIKAHSTSAGNACINNLRQIDAAANQFALEHNLTNGSPINFPDDLTPYIKLNSAGKIPECPNGGVYHISKVGETPTCSLGTTVTPAHVLP
jgi:hypothetical protein